MPNNFLKNILTDLKVELMDEFDMNFHDKAFFGNPWPHVTIPNHRGSMMIRSGALRRGMRAAVIGSGITFTNSMPYAKIQNEGGVIVITRKMQKFFWAMYYDLMPKEVYSVKTHRINSRLKKGFVAEAMYWKAMALKKVGTKIIIKERRFIGHHPNLDKHVEFVVDANFRELDTYIRSLLKPKF